VVHAGKRDPLQWSSIALPLIVPDLPVFLWWNDSIDADLPLLSALLEACDRLVVDSSSAVDFATIVQLMNAHGSWLAVSDLSWARLTPWRHAIAGFYDHLACGDRLQEIQRIQIAVESEVDSPGQAWLLIGWLATSLGWTHVDLHHLRTAKQTDVVIEVNRIPGACCQITEVNLFSPDAEYKVARSTSSDYLETRMRLQNKHARQLVKMPPQNLSALISKEVSILGHDVVYEKSIRFLSTIAPAR
jgi:glucose-6-phosphate dehydrogenase assembly protein OpcA